MATHNNVLFREIYKNAWLRRLPVGERKPGTTIKKAEKVWTVFCIHDDLEPFLEFYTDQKIATTHCPETSLSLGTTLHISPTICPQDDEFEFVITLSSDLIRLTAPSRDVMIDWVETLCTKLREMHVLSPKENAYSRNPEARPPLLPTRDPNSPLPLLPTIPNNASTMPGLESFQQRELQERTDYSLRVDLPSQTAELTENPLSLIIPSTSNPDLNQDGAANLSRTETSDSRDNVTVIEVSAGSTSSCSDFSVFDFTFMGICLDRQELSSSTPTPIVPEPIVHRTRVNSSSINSPGVMPSSSLMYPRHSQQRPQRPCELTEESLYEHVFLPMSLSSSSQYIPQISRGRQISITRSNHRRTDESNISEPSEVSERIRVAAVNTEVNESRSQIRSPLQPPPQPFLREFSSEISLRLTLREQQVLRLKKEIGHSGGVRVQLRRKDCIGSIALVDFGSAVWIAGWKQKDHPMLYSALHIGDQLVSIAGISVQNAEDAQRLIRGAPSLYVELIIRRVPCGRVYALQRESEGQDLGIIQEGRTASIKEIMGGSIAALGGMSSHIPTVDGLSLTNCVLTEINGRPLNLFFKDNEVRDRLNAVGLDISLLVQPLDLIKHIKKRLKSMRNYKEYIVQ